MKLRPVTTGTNNSDLRTVSTQRQPDRPFQGASTPWTNRLRLPVPARPHRGIRDYRHKPEDCSRRPSSRVASVQRNNPGACARAAKGRLAGKLPTHHRVPVSSASSGYTDLITLRHEPPSLYIDYLSVASSHEPLNRFT